MSQRIFNTRRGGSDSRLIRYLAQDRASGRSQLWQQMDRNRKGAKDASRVKQYLRIERGYTA